MKMGSGAGIIETLEERVRQLEQVTQNLEVRLAVLEALYARNQENCEHHYPVSWLATTPPSCLKCGKPAESFSLAGYTATRIK